MTLLSPLVLDLHGLGTLAAQHSCRQSYTTLQSAHCLSVCHTVFTFMSGTYSGPKGVSTLVRVACTRQVPRNSSGNVRSDGPPPMEDQALSTASGRMLACTHDQLAAHDQLTAPHIAFRDKPDRRQGGRSCLHSIMVVHSPQLRRTPDSIKSNKTHALAASTLVRCLEITAQV